MPSIEIDAAHRMQVEALKVFVRESLADMPAEVRMVFAIEMGRLFKPELDELRRRARSAVEGSHDAD